MVSAPACYHSKWPRRIFPHGNEFGRIVSLDLRRVTLNLAAKTLWHIPGRFGIARVLGPSYSLRCVVFHNVSAADSPFTKGMGVTITPSDFEVTLRFLTRYYTPVSLEAVLSDSDGRGLPPRPILVTFDDGYASAMESAALCHKLGVPAIFFLNAAFLDNRSLAPDNLVCYAANVLGMETLNQAARAVKGAASPRMRSMVDVFRSFFPNVSLPEREAFLDALISLGGISERDLAEKAALYLTRKQLFDLASLGFEIGNHTYTHVHCRSLRAKEFIQEIDRNKTELEAGSGVKIRSFSLPYGSSADLTGSLAAHLRLSGHEAVFLSESVANSQDINTFHLDRVSPRACSDEGFFFEIEVMPRLRAMRSRVRADKEHIVN